jgi:F-type H+-transporting ATPase subunit b
VRQPFWTGRWAAAGTILLATAARALAEEHGGKPNLFDADIGNFVFTLIIFGLVVFILGKFAWRPVLAVLNERERVIRESLATARQEREAAAALLAEYQAQLDRARQEASAIVAEGRRDAEVTARRVQDQARQETEEQLARARREIQLATDTARKQLHDEVSQLAVQVAGRVLSRQLSPTEHQALVAEALREMQTAPGVKMN